MSKPAKLVSLEQQRHAEEECLLATALMNNPQAIKLVAQLPMDVWSTKLHQQCATAIRTLYLSSKPIDPAALITFDGAVEWLITLTSTSLTTITPDVCAETIMALYRDYEVMTMPRLISYADMKAKLDTLEKPVLNGHPKPVNVMQWFTTAPPDLSYVFNNVLPIGTVGGVVSMGGMSKSMLTQILVTSAAIGKPLLPSFVPATDMRVLWFESEDTADEDHRRQARIFRAFNLDEDDAALYVRNVTAFIGQGFPIIEPDRRNVYHPTPYYQWFKELVAQYKPSLVCIGSRAHFFAGDENDNSAVTQFMALLRDLTNIHPCAIWLIHHVNKRQESDATAAAGRGASAGKDAMRVLYNIVPPTEKELAINGISDQNNYIKLVATKANWTPLAAKPIWLKRLHGINGGVLVEEDMDAKQADTETQMLAKVAQWIADNLVDGTSVRAYAKDAAMKDWRSAAKETFGAKFGSRDFISKAFDFAFKTSILEKTYSPSSRGRAEIIPQIPADDPPPF